MIDLCAIDPPGPGRALVPILGLLFLLGSCSQPEIKPPVPVTPPEERSTAPVVRVPAPEPTSPYQPELLIRPLSVVVPVGAIYICVKESAGHPDLDRAAADAVRRWRFEPARRGTQAVAEEVELPFRWRLER